MIATAKMAAIAGALALGCSGVQAANVRTWISGKGADNAGCGPIATPCRTLQFAHDNTTPGGEINVLDSAGFGAVVINKAINIVSEGSVAGVLSVGAGNAIAIAAGATDDIVLRGLTIEGANTGTNGVLFTSGGTLAVANCVIQGFKGTGGNGVAIRPTAGVPKIQITNTTVSNNANAGVLVKPTSGARTNVIIDNVTVSNQQRGVDLDATGTNSLLSAVVSNSRAAGNTIGFALSGFSLNVYLDGSYATHGTYGVYNISGPFLSLSRMLITGNVTGIYTDVHSYATSDSYANNIISDNETNVDGAPLGSKFFK